jgi:hypothetical protein
MKSLLNYLLGVAAVAGGDGSSVTEGTAEVGDVTVFGASGSAITSKEVTITLSGAAFKTIPVPPPVSVADWFTNLPAGLTARVMTTVEGGATTITITISGTPSVERVAPMVITIPGDRLVGTPTPPSIIVAANANAKYDILPGIADLTALEAFADAVNGGQYGLNARLTNANPIDASGATYIPIAQDTAHPYTGTFDGNGHTINIALSGTTSFLALFGINEGTIKNLTVTGTVTATIDRTKAKPESIDYVAAVAAYNMVGGAITRVINKATITAKDNYVNPSHKDVSIHNTGGITGFNGMDTINPDSPDAGKTYVTGGNILQCRNEGDIIGGANKIGGIAGENGGTIEECANTGDITCYKKDEAHAAWPGAAGMAGRNGNNNDSIEKASIKNCRNTGKIIDKTDQNIDHDDYGGITGWCDKDSTVKSCYTTGQFEQWVEDPEHPGTYILHALTGTKNPIIGSIDADVTAMTDGNNYALDTIFRSSEDTILTGNLIDDPEYMKTQDFVDDLNNGDLNGPYVNPNLEVDYPILRWEEDNLPPATDPEENQKKS